MDRRFRSPAFPWRRRNLLAICLAGPAAAALAVSAAAAPALPLYQPKITAAEIYFFNPAIKPALKYNHDVDIVKFRGRFFAAWNANEARAEDVPGQFNFLSVSDDFCRWTEPVRMFTAEAGAGNPVESDNQWQPNFINWKDEVVYCAWSDFVARRVYVADSRDGVRWRNVEVTNAPLSLAGKVCGFPTNHGLATSKGVLLFPCSLPSTDSPRAVVGRTRYAGVLRSEDRGKSWSWSEPIEAVSWSQAGENPAEFGGDVITLWEPMLFEQADGRIGLLIRNSTAQENPERAEKPHRMLLYATSSDQGRNWTKARPVEVDTICSRSYAVSGVGTSDSLLMVMNDHHVRVPERIARDRYFLALYCAPVCDPDLLLPGPIVQPAGGTAFYPNGFVDGGKLYVAYSFGGIHSSVVEPLPDFSRPFLLPRGGRAGLRWEGDLAILEQRQSSLGLVLTEKLTRQEILRLAFDLNVRRYDGTDRPVLTLGGKTRQGSVMRVIYSEKAGANVFQLRLRGNEWVDLAKCELGAWNHFEFEMASQALRVSVNHSAVRTFPVPLLRKICFGGLYVPPEWPMGMTRPADVRLRLDTLVIE